MHHPARCRDLPFIFKYFGADETSYGKPKHRREGMPDATEFIPERTRM